MTIPSPCISICSLDETSGLCKGCRRTSDEIANWLYYTDPQKQAVLDTLRTRRPPESTS